MREEWRLEGNIVGECAEILDHLYRPDNLIRHKGFRIPNLCRG
jgi:hypothetical protein